MNDTELRDRLRTLTGSSIGTTDLKRVERRARTLRLRRGVATAIAAGLGLAAIAVPLSGLDRLGEGVPLASPSTTEPPIRFDPLDGWNTAVMSSPMFDPYTSATAAVISNVPLTPDPDSIYPPGLSNRQLDQLPADGIAIDAEQVLFTRNPIPVGSGYQPLTLPLALSDADVSHGGGEGLARQDLTSYYQNGLVNGRPIVVHAWFGTAHPGVELVRQAQAALEQLVVLPAAPPTAALNDVGVSMQLPGGWDGLLYSYGDGDANLVASTTGPVGFDWERPRAALGPSDIAIVMQESPALVEIEGWAPLQGPLAIGPYNLCDGCELLDDGRPPESGHVLYLDTFTTGGRAFAVYVEFGSAPVQADLDRANAVLGTLVFEPLANPTSTPSPGTTRVGPIYDGEDAPEVTATDADRTLTSAYEHASMILSAGWTGQVYPVAGLERPISLLAAGSWNFTPGGYCGPINALREMPDDGALVWVDGYGAHAPDGVTFGSKPSSVDLSTAETDPSPCFGGATPYVFRWSIGDRFLVAHAAIGADASAQTIAHAEATLASIGIG
jgi:hypothetical protein